MGSLQALNVAHSGLTALLDLEVKLQVSRRYDGMSLCNSGAHQKDPLPVVRNGSVCHRNKRFEVSNNVPYEHVLEAWCMSWKYVAFRSAWEEA
jgi:hypothetical protein